MKISWSSLLSPSCFLFWTTANSKKLGAFRNVQNNPFYHSSDDYGSNLKNPRHALNFAKQKQNGGTQDILHTHTGVVTRTKVIRGLWVSADAFEIDLSTSFQGRPRFSKRSIVDERFVIAQHYYSLLSPYHFTSFIFIIAAKLTASTVCCSPQNSFDTIKFNVPSWAVKCNWQFSD